MLWSGGGLRKRRRGRRGKERRGVPGMRGQKASGKASKYRGENLHGAGRGNGARKRGDRGKVIDAAVGILEWWGATEPVGRNVAG
jgi:hypothetical protein